MEFYSFFFFFVNLKLNNYSLRNVVFDFLVLKQPRCAPGGKRLNPAGLEFKATVRFSINVFKKHTGLAGRGIL